MKFFKFLFGTKELEKITPAAEEPAEAVEANVAEAPSEQPAVADPDDGQTVEAKEGSLRDAEEKAPAEAATEQAEELPSTEDETVDKAGEPSVQPDTEGGSTEEAPAELADEEPSTEGESADKAEESSVQPDTEGGSTEEDETKQTEEAATSEDQGQEVDMVYSPEEKQKLWLQQSRLQDHLGRIRFRHQRVRLACDGIDAWGEGKSHITESVETMLKTLPVKMWGDAFVRMYAVRKIKRDPQGCEEEVRDVVAQYRASHPELETGDYIESMLEEHLGNHSAAAKILHRAVSERKNAGLCALSLARFQIEQGLYDEAAATANYGLCAMAGSGGNELGDLLYLRALARDGQLQIIHTETAQPEEMKSLQRMYRQILFRFRVSWKTRLHILRRLNMLEIMIRL